MRARARPRCGSTRRDGSRKELEDGWAVITPGDPAKSEVIRRTFATNEDDLMPPPASQLKLAPAEKELLRKWIAQGAEYKPHWSLLPVAKVSPPTPGDNSWVKNPIDAFVLAKLDDEKLSPSPEAARETLLRRLALNLTGLPPTTAEMDAFLADKSPDAYERAVQHYLGSPAYGERMAMDWLDLARYADTYGYQADVERDLSPWRDWVIRAFNENLPYDRFSPLATRRRPAAQRHPRAKLATAFNRLHRQTNEGGSMEEEFRTEYAADRVNTFGTAMLGLTMDCARCHDHKFDPDHAARLLFARPRSSTTLTSRVCIRTSPAPRPLPALLLWPEAKEAQHAELKPKSLPLNASSNKSPATRRSEFQSWLKTAKVSPPPPVARFTFDTVTNNTTPDSVSTNVADWRTGRCGWTRRSRRTRRTCPRQIPGSRRCVTDRRLPPRTTPSSSAATIKWSAKAWAISSARIHSPSALWLKPTETQDRAVVLHHSRAWTDSGSRGYELVLDHGKPFFGLIHFWPGNAIAVRAQQALPTNEWSQIVVTYDGSSRAAGIRLYLNGTPLETEVVRDHLYKDIVHRAEWGDMRTSAKSSCTLAGRFRDSGFKNGLIDDLQVFDVLPDDADAGSEAHDVAGGNARGSAHSITSSPGSTNRIAPRWRS